MKDRGLVVGTIGLLVVLAFCLFAVYIGLYPTPVANQHFIDISLGALVTQFANVTGYYFGSSRTTEQHVADLRAAAKLQVTTPPPLERKN